MAEIIALDLELESEGEWCGWSVEVRNSDGRHLFSVAVQSVDVIAA